MVSIAIILTLVIWCVSGLVLFLQVFTSSFVPGFVFLFILGPLTGFVLYKYLSRKTYPKAYLPEFFNSLIVANNTDTGHFSDNVETEVRERVKNLIDQHVEQSLNEVDAARPPSIEQTQILDGINHVLMGNIQQAGFILGIDNAEAVHKVILSLIEEEKNRMFRFQSSMDSEFNRINLLSSDLGNSVESMSVSSRNAAKANSIAFEARDIAVQNREIVDQMVSSITDISQSSGRIKDIAKSINTIAFQTNLLALNASIEAARAGKAGLGFNVVATEVKTLAKQASEAADQTQELTDKIIKQIATAESQVKENTSAFGSLADKSNETGELIEKIQESSLVSSHHMDRIHIGLIQASVSLKEKCDECKRTGSEQGAHLPELLLPSSYTLQTQWYPQAQFAGYYMALEKGYFQEAGLKVELRDGGAEDNPVFNLVKGETQFITAWLSTALTVYDRGAEISLLSQLFQKSGLTLVALKDSGIRQIKDLKQKTISSWGGIFEYPIQAMNLEHELDMEILDTGADITSIQNGDVDVIAVMSYNELLGLYDQGFTNDKLSMIRMNEVGYNFPEDGLYTTDALLKKDKNACQQFQTAVIRGWEDVLQDRSFGLEITMQHHKRSPMPTSQSHQERMLDEVCRLIQAPQGMFGALQQEGFDRTVEALRRIGMVKKSINITDFNPFMD